MRRGIYLAVLGVFVLGAVIVATGGAQVYPVRLDQQEPQPAAPTPPSLMLADVGLEFPDGTVQITAAGGGPPAPVPRTGQSAVLAPGDDGDLQLGVVWPNPRFTDHGNGTVTDNLTGLIWLDDAACFGALHWNEALAKAADLFDGCPDCGSDMDCGLTDGSIAGQWRLPNLRELQSLIHYGVFGPTVPDTAGTGQWSEGAPFSGVVSSYYWSSTTSGVFGTSAWVVSFNYGSVGYVGKVLSKCVWPVRGGQAAVLATIGRAQVYPVRLDQQEPQPAAPTPPSLVLADGGLEFPDGTVQITAAATGPPAPLPRTGQTTCYDAAGAVVTCGTGVGLAQDGDLQLGVTWPNPRFTDNGNGTVTDNLTGLIWLQNAHCPNATRQWATALSDVMQLNADGTMNGNYCGDTSNGGSHQTDWRLANIRELQSLVHYGVWVFNPAVPNTAGTGKWVEGDPFSGVQSWLYWSSTTPANSAGVAWGVDVDDGTVGPVAKTTNGGWVWPVRGGQ